MRLFGRRRDDEDLEDEKYSRKKFIEKKELSEKDKFFKEKKERKKRFEIKPWTRVERFFVIGVFLSTVIVSVFLALYARAWKLPNLPRLNFKLPSILSSETIILEKESGRIIDSEVIKKFEELTEPLSGVYGFFVLDLTDNHFFGVNEEEIFEAGSFNKLPVMLTMYKEAELGNINLSTQYVLRDADKIEGSGSLVNKPAGTKISYKDLVMAMGHESDNTAFHIGKSILGEAKIIETMEEIGMAPSLITQNETTPYEIGLFFKTLNDAKVVSRETRDAILGYLTNTIYENWIAKDISVPVAHKFGTLVHVRNDAGIVMGEKPYILVVMSKGVIEKEADEAIPIFASELYKLQSVN